MTKRELKKMGIDPDDFDVILDDRDIVYDPYEMVTTNDDDEEE